MILQSSNINDYLKMTLVIDWGNPAIQRKTAEVSLGH